VKPSEPSALRVVLDTQLLLRGAVAKTESLTARIYDAWRDGRFVLVLSESILTEIETVLSRPEVLGKLRLSPLEARALVTLLRRQAVLVTPTISIRRSRDPADDKFLECAVRRRGPLRGQRGCRPAQPSPGSRHPHRGRPCLLASAE